MSLAVFRFVPWIMAQHGLRSLAWDEIDDIELVLLIFCGFEA
jgi:hypothetical protein